MDSIVCNKPNGILLDEFWHYSHNTYPIFIHGKDYFKITKKDFIKLSNITLSKKFIEIIL